MTQNNEHARPRSRHAIAVILLLVSCFFGSQTIRRQSTSKSRIENRPDPVVLEMAGLPRNQPVFPDSYFLPPVIKTTNGLPQVEPQTEKQDSDNPEEREKWFWMQRTYPFDQIPTDARRQAWERRPLHRQETDAFGVSANPTWQAIGPAATSPAFVNNWGLTSGRINSIAVSPANTQLILVGSATGGIWRSTDGGATFTAVTDTQVDLAVGSIAFSNSNPSIAYAGMGDPHGYLGTGVLKSTDAGQTWTRVSNSTMPSPGEIYKIAVDPTDPNRVYVAQYVFKASSGTVFSSGFFVSTDGGVNWTKTLGCLPKDIAIHPTTPQTLYLSVTRNDTGTNNPAGLYKSTDGGMTWQNSYASTYSSTSDARVAVTPAAPQNVYLYIGGQLNGSLDIQVVVSTDGGATWSSKGAANVDNGQFGYNTYIAVDPGNANLIYLGTRDVFKSTDGGTTYTNLTGNFNSSGGYQPGSSTTHPDQHSFAFVPGASSSIFIGNDGGLSKSTNAGTSFQSLNATLSLTQFTSIAIHPTDSTLTYGGAQDNGNQRRDPNNSSQWHEIISGDGGACVINAADPSIIFMSYVNGTIWRFRNNGDSFDGTVGDKATKFNNDRIAFYPPIAGNGSNSTLYFGSYRLYVSTDLGNTWTAPGGALDLTKNNGTLSAIGVSKSNPNVIYTGSSDGRVMTSSDGGQTWTDITGSLPNRFIKSITVHPTNPSAAYLTVSGYGTGHVFSTTDQGTTWTDISGNLPDIPTNALLLGPTNLNVIFVGTDIGVFRSTTGGNTWESISTGMPPSVVTGFAAQASGLIQVSTYGRGAYLLMSVDQAITFNPIPTKTFGDQPFSPGATTNSGLPITYSIVSGPATINGNNVTITGAGSVTVQADQPGNGTFNPAAPVQQTFTVNKANQTITFNQISNHTFGDPAFALSATATSGLPVTFSIVGGTGTGTINGTNLTITGAGSIVIQADRAASANFNPAAPLQQTLTVNKANQTITFPVVPDQTFGGSPFSLSATSSTNLAVSYSVTLGLNLVSITGSQVTILGAGSVTIQASQSGNSNFNAAPNVPRSFTINKINQTINFGPLTSKTVGDPPFSLTATSTSTLPVTFSATAGGGFVSITGNTVTITGAGSVTIQADQVGNANFNAALPVPESFTIAKGTALLTLNTPTQIADGSPKVATVTTTPPGVSGVVITYNNSATPPTLAGTYAVSASLNNPNFNGNVASGSLRIVSFSPSNQSVNPGTSGSAATPPASSPSISATLNHAVGGTAAGLTVGIYSGNPSNRGMLETGGGYGDVKVTNSNSGDTATINYYYPASITGTNETQLQFFYFTGFAWALVKDGSGNLATKNTTDNLDGTTSGGRFTVTLNNTNSSPRVNQLTGTVFSAALAIIGDCDLSGVINVSDLFFMANFLAGNVTLTPTQKGACDVLNDNKGLITVQDLFVLANFLAGNTQTLPVNTAGPISNPGDIVPEAFLSPPQDQLNLGSQEQLYRARLNEFVYGAFFNRRKQTPAPS